MTAKATHSGALYEEMETLLKIDNVSLELGEGNGRKLILRNVNGEIKNIAGHGQVVALLGPSGIGKTQLFKILAGLQPATQGTILLGEKSEPVQRGQVGVVAQDYPLLEHRSVLGNLMVAARRNGNDANSARVKSMEMLERFKLADKAKSYPAQLSGGQRQRIAIAQQLLCSDHFLLMDEPFSGLDVVMLEKVCQTVNEVAHAHELNTIIVVTHDIYAAAKVADHIWLLGRDRDAKGAIVPGAYIQEVYNLIDIDLAWHPDVEFQPEFPKLMREIKARFQTL